MAGLGGFVPGPMAFHPPGDWPVLVCLLPVTYVLIKRSKAGSNPLSDQVYHLCLLWLWSRQVGRSCWLGQITAYTLTSSWSTSIVLYGHTKQLSPGCYSKITYRKITGLRDFDYTVPISFKLLLALDVWLKYFTLDIFLQSVLVCLCNILPFDNSIPLTLLVVVEIHVVLN